MEVLIASVIVFAAAMTGLGLGVIRQRLGGKRPASLSGGGHHAHARTSGKRMAEEPGCCCGSGQGGCHGLITDVGRVRVEISPAGAQSPDQPAPTASRNETPEDCDD